MQVYKNQNPGAQFLDPALGFNKYATEPKTVSRKLAQALHAMRGDSAATVSVMMNYYKISLLKRTNNTPSTMPPSAQINDVNRDLEAEINDSAFKLFVDTVDAHYEEQMINTIAEFSEARPYLVSDDVISQLYSRFRRDMSTYHRMFATIVSTSYSCVPTGEECDPAETEQDQL